ncbi:MAG: 50S ribosomal protein L11 methyltransferase, partial [Lachnospiraceae bacterium]|nr:50S ribosomal protein L11 methyltransferase [Lachnospiraceae bacterium]
MQSWTKFIIETTEAAEEAVIAALMEMGITSVETIDARPITEEEKKAMFIDYLPDPKDDDGTA